MTNETPVLQDANELEVPGGEFNRALVRSRRGARLRFSAGNRLRLFQSGTDYFATLIERIRTARKTVVLEVYMFCADAAGAQVSAALVEAARRGLSVRVITDGVGTAQNLPYYDDWRAHGVRFRIFNPHLFGRFGFSRTHRKIASIDGEIAFVGGINIVDDLENEGVKLDQPRWDFALEIAGPVAAEVHAAFEQQWQRLDSNPVRATLRRTLTFVRDGGPARVEAPPSPPQLAFVARDNLNRRRTIERAYLHAIGHAREEIVLANPYFMPGHKLRGALVSAAKRGLRVKLLIGRKEFRLLDYAVPLLYGMLLRAGAQIAEYDKTMLHGKVAVIDGSWATVGSSNLDALSLLLNHEANVIIANAPEVGELRDAILAAFEESPKIDPRLYAARPLPERLLNWFTYNAYRVAMKMLTVGEYD
ncbi:cardiolipin synthase ClsB [Pararobbsia alpina]|uniref:Cardiolipin synthase B n=1 Tax=Pararobbsia alpina TaxID=621374 RepID=A0A6S7C2M3_9BURK|nr:cardiolipin synthase ClsB [Pararobbsia alpina]CAB3779608.1 Cardiolipin synthase B [Pararobbsia alpina]